MFSTADLQLNSFISYSRRDLAFVEALDRWLATVGAYPDPASTQSLLNVWFDQRSIPLGTPFLDIIRAGLKSTGVVLLLVSPDAMASKFVQHEIELARARTPPPVIVPVVCRAVDETTLTGTSAALYTVASGLHWLELWDLAVPYTAHPVLRCMRRFVRGPLVLNSAQPDLETLSERLWDVWAEKMVNLFIAHEHPRAERMVIRKLYDTRHPWAVDFFGWRVRQCMAQQPEDAHRAQYYVHALACLEDDTTQQKLHTLRDWWRSSFPVYTTHLLEYALRNPIPPTD